MLISLLTSALSTFAHVLASSSTVSSFHTLQLSFASLAASLLQYQKHAAEELPLHHISPLSDVYTGESLHCSLLTHVIMSSPVFSVLIPPVDLFLSGAQRNSEAPCGYE
jgi:hypothetical protein